MLNQSPFEEKTVDPDIVLVADFFAKDIPGGAELTTQALLESVPVLGRGKNQDINPIKGSTPDPYNRPVGCQFAPRCNWQTESCYIMPEITQINDTHQIRCHKYEQFFEKYNEKRNS